MRDDYWAAATLCAMVFGMMVGAMAAQSNVTIIPPQVCPVKEDKICPAQEPAILSARQIFPEKQCPAPKTKIITRYITKNICPKPEVSIPDNGTFR
jgi:hypothetical protein